MNNADTISEIRRLLTEQLNPSSLEIIDDSHLHEGHAGAREGGHFTVRIVSSAFNDLTRIQQHRLVYEALADLLPGQIHALAIEADGASER